jgi:hypothetical protein
MKSVTSRLIDRIIASGPALLLKKAGYRKGARSFHLETGGLFKVIQFQASMWNTPNAAQFTANLNIVLPFFHEKWTGQPFPSNPASAAPVLSQRIGYLMPEQGDFWWELLPDSDVGRIATEVATVLSERGLPFLDEHANLEVVIEAVGRKDAIRRMVTNPDLGLAILLSYQGKHTKAARVIQELADKNTHEGFAETIRLIARRLKLSVTN